MEEEELASHIDSLRFGDGQTLQDDTNYLEEALHKEMSDLDLDGAPKTYSYRDALMKSHSGVPDEAQQGGVEPVKKKIKTWSPPKIVVKQVKREREFDPRDSVDVFEGAEDDGLDDFLFRQIYLDKLSHVLVRARSNLSVKQKAQKEKRIAAK